MSVQISNGIGTAIDTGVADSFLVGGEFLVVVATSSIEENRRFFICVCVVVRVFLYLLNSKKKIISVATIYM